MCLQTPTGNIKGWNPALASVQTSLGRGIAFLDHYLSSRDLIAGSSVKSSHSWIPRLNRGMTTEKLIAAKNPRAAGILKLPTGASITHYGIAAHPKIWLLADSGAPDRRLRWTDDKSS